MSDTDARQVFAFLNEIAIIGQLSRAMFETRLPDGFLVSHFSVLNHLVRVGDGSTPLEMANAFQVPKTTMTHTLAGLEKAQLIEMRPNPEDGRSKCVWLTDAGRNFREEAIAALGPEIAKVLDAIPLERFQAALPVLQELRIYLDKARD